MRENTLSVAAMVPGMQKRNMVFVEVKDHFNPSLSL
jgi:hypothetical protein